MRLKDLVSVVINKNNKQVNLNIKKIKLKKEDMDISELLNMKINREFLK